MGLAGQITHAHVQEVKQSFCVLSACLLSAQKSPDLRKMHHGGR